jgi:hypothetical protein
MLLIMKSPEEIRKTRAQFEEEVALDSQDLRARCKDGTITADEDRLLSAELNRKREIVRTLHWVLDEFYSETLT